MIVHDKDGSFVRGIGSVLNILPDTDYNKVIRNQSVNSRIHSNWKRVGQSIQTATKQYQDGKAQK